MLDASIALWATSLSYGFVLVGLASRSRPPLHARWMMAAITFDLIVLSGVEIERHAVETVASGDLTMLQLLHVWSSTFTILFYVPVGLLGALRLRARLARGMVPWHRRFGLAAFGFRTLGLATILAIKSPPWMTAALLIALPLSFGMIAARHFSSRLISSSGSAERPWSPADPAQEGSPASEGIFSRRPA